MKNKIYMGLFLASFCLTTDFSFAVEQATQKQQPPAQNQNVQDTAAQQALDASLEESKAAGEAWLKLLDQGNYEQSWDKSAATMQLLVPKKSWKELMDGLRKPLGTLKSRKLVDQRTAKDPHGLPKGDYMVLVYSTSFSGKASTNELITMVKESDGKWKVLTYQVK